MTNAPISKYIEAQKLAAKLGWSIDVALWNRDGMTTDGFRLTNTDKAYVDFAFIEQTLGFLLGIEYERGVKTAKEQEQKDNFTELMNNDLPS